MSHSGPEAALADLDVCRFRARLITFPHVASQTWHYRAATVITLCVKFNLCSCRKNDLAWELGEFFFFFLRPLAINNRITVGHLLMARNWNQKCSLRWRLKGVLSLVGRSSPARLNCFASRHSKNYKTHCHRMTALHALQLQIDST